MHREHAWDGAGSQVAWSRSWPRSWGQTYGRQRRLGRRTAIRQLDRCGRAGRAAWRSAPWLWGTFDLRLAVVLGTPSRAVDSLEQDREVYGFSSERFSSPARVVGEPARYSITRADTNAVAGHKILGCTHTLICACKRFHSKRDLDDQGFLTAQTSRIQERSTAAGDLGVGPRIGVVGGIEQIPRERVERSFDRGIDSAATARRRRCVIVLEAPGDREPGRPRWRRWAMNHRRAERVAIRESAHAKQTPR